MNRLVFVGGLLFIEAASHAIYAGTYSQASVYGIVVPALFGAAPAICRSANEWFLLLIEGADDIIS